MTGEETVTIRKPVLSDFVADIFCEAGVSPHLAKEWAASLVWADLRGIETHGVLRVSQYLGMLDRREINRKPDIAVVRKSGAMALIEADLAPGAVAMSRAMDEAIAIAEVSHIGWCTARNVAHAGALGYIASQAVSRPMAAIVMGASSPLMAYHGTRVPSLGTNPLAISFPTAKGPPFLLDMSTSTAARGKVLKAISAGQQIPIGWGIDAQGRDTTDPSKVETLLPFSGPKGSGLSLMLECLASLMASNPILTPLLNDPSLSPGARQNGVAVAVDLAAFGEVNAMLAEADKLRQAIAGLPRAEGVSRLFLPGEIEHELMAKRETSGIPLATGTVRQLSEIAQSLGMTTPF